MSTRLRFCGLLLLFVASCAGTPSVRLDPVPGRPDRPHWNLSSDGLAIDGYDPVAYFPEGGASARRGSKDLAHTHDGVTYWFHSLSNLRLFEANPARYEPAYGGWCAYAMADEDKIRIHPKSFLIQGGRLMLFYDGLFADTRRSWSQEPDDLEFRADAGWKTTLQE